MSWERNYFSNDDKKYMWFAGPNEGERAWDYDWRYYWDEKVKADSMTNFEFTLVAKEKEPSIERILWNGDKNATTVKWSDNTFTTVKLSPTDVPPSLLNAVSAAYVKKKYGSNSQFKKKLRDQFGFYNDSLYETISEIRFLDFVGSISKWNEIKEEKLYLLPSKGAGDVKRKKTSTR